VHFGTKNDDTEIRFPHHFPGSIICWSDSLSDSSIEANGQYFPLEFDDVKSKAKQISEETLKQYLATIPQFYQHPSTVFTGLGESKKYSERKGFGTG
jgi:hypothetical protein